MCCGLSDRFFQLHIARDFSTIRATSFYRRNSQYCTVEGKQTGLMSLVIRQNADNVTTVTASFDLFGYIFLVRFNTLLRGRVMVKHTHSHLGVIYIYKYIYQHVFEKPKKVRGETS